MDVTYNVLGMEVGVAYNVLGMEVGVAYNVLGMGMGIEVGVDYNVGIGTRLWCGGDWMCLTWCV